ncbi:MAG: PilZ domain-containing protein [Kofleriaceae bacterium]|jgi:Tfp pilus assembly protein PilZ|nr:PilZ domain-containing protein [Kofleriaceae bacterium]MBP9167177.1 PilZ domain-containing protein [Kofleriaceae bacterium]MBP9862784.1 PilZ domain-containing protein [Kofleriaceae bacterium]
MRLVTLAYASAADFLAAYHPADGGTLSTRTRTDGNIGERVLLEVSFPGLPNRALVRADVVGIAFEHGLRFALAVDDATTRDFLVGLATGEVRVEATVHRDHARFPASLSATWHVEGAPATVTTVEDLSAGGAFVLAEVPPAIGAAVAVTITAPSGEALPLTGHVAWTRHGKRPGFGVDFVPTTGDVGRTLRALLRHASETATVDLGPPAE